MATKIPSRNELYYDYKKKSFFVKSQFSKKFRIGMIIGLFLGFLIPASATYNYNKKNIDYGVFKIPAEDIALINYVTRINKSEGNDIALATIKWANHFEIDPKFILAIQKVESRFDRYAISSAGAMGLMQVIPKWHIEKLHTAKKVVGSPELFGIDSNIYMGIQVIKDCLSKYKVVNQALKCYNGSIDMKTTYDADVLREYNNIKQYVKASI